MNSKVGAILAELRRRVEALYGPRLYRMVLFGSQAREAAAPGSDIDVLVVMEGPVNPTEEIARTVKEVTDLSLQHNEVLSCVFISKEEFEYERSPLLLNGQREGVPV